MSVSSRPPSGFPFTLILSRTPAMIGRISVSLFVLAVTVSIFAAADEVTNPLAINLTGFRDELLSEMKDDLTKLLKLMSAEAMQMKQKFVTDVDRELKKCVKINDTTTRIFCFKDIQEKAKITEAKKRESIENDIDELKIRVADEFQLKFEEGVRNRSEDLKKRLKGIFKDLQKIPRELQGKVKHAIDAGVEDAQRRQENITAQFGKPLAIVLIVISASFLCVAPPFSMILLKCVKPQQRDMKLLKKSLENKWEAQVSLAKKMSKKSKKQRKKSIHETCRYL